MSLIRYSGKTKLMHFDKADTTVRIVDGGAVQFSAAGKLNDLANDSDDRIFGVCRRTMALADTSPDTSGKSVPVEVPVENYTEWLIDTDSDGGASATDVGRYCALDTGDTVNINARADVSDSDIPHILITGVVSATKIIGILARTALSKPATHDFDT
ncbi:MAG: hypothetical protein AABY15_08685 [Nanoarchaeota archaeon]